MTDATNTCATCKYWVERPIDPNNLAAPRSGDCREGPPAVVLMPTQTGALSLSMVYPPLPANFPACGRHELAIVRG